IDPKLNIPVPSNATLGPILTQRAETIGRHKFYIAFTYQYFQFEDIDGMGLKNLPIFLPLQGGNVVTATNNRLDLKASQFTAYFTYGLTTSVDVSVAVPIIDMHERMTPAASSTAWCRRSAPRVLRIKRLRTGPQRASEMSTSRRSGGCGNLSTAGLPWVRNCAYLQETPRISWGPARLEPGLSQFLRMAAEFPRTSILRTRSTAIRISSPIVAARTANFPTV